jgi:hypothetical protein
VTATPLKKKAVEQMFSPGSATAGRHHQFQRPHPRDHEMVVDKFMKELNGQLAAKKVKLLLAEVRTWLAKRGTIRYGARPLARVIQTEVKNKLSKEIAWSPGERRAGARPCGGQDLQWRFPDSCPYHPISLSEDLVFPPPARLAGGSAGHRRGFEPSASCSPTHRGFPWYSMMSPSVVVPGPPAGAVQRVHLSQSLVKTIRRGDFTVSMDQAWR